MLRTLLASLLLAVPASSQTFTVGPTGDFAQVTDALASPLVVPGSKIFVAAGTYNSFEVTKPVSLYSQGAGAKAISIHDVPEFQLVGFYSATLSVRNVTTKGLIQNCSASGNSFGGVSGGLSPYNSVAVFENVQNVLVERSNFGGTSTCYPDANYGTTDAASVIASRATFVDCKLYGGTDFLFIPPFECESHYPTATVGMSVQQNSSVDLVGCTLWGYANLTFSTSPGLLVQASSVVVRGRADNVILGAGTHAIQADGLSTVFFSGVTLTPQTLPPFTVKLPLAEAFLIAQGTFGLGDQPTVEHFAPNAQPMWTGFSALPSGAPLAFPGHELWLDPAALGGIFATIGAGINTPIGLPVTIPATPTLIGHTLGVQALTWVNGALELLAPYVVVVGI